MRIFIIIVLNWLVFLSHEMSMYKLVVVHLFHFSYFTIDWELLSIASSNLFSTISLLRERIIKNIFIGLVISHTSNKKNIVHVIKPFIHRTFISSISIICSLSSLKNAQIHFDILFIRAPNVATNLFLKVKDYFLSHSMNIELHK